MAIVKAPLLSLGATGQLGKTIVMSTWKGIKTAREYVVPANPRTIAQVAQRALMTLVTAFYKNTLTNAAMRTSWNLTATLSGKPQSGYNAFSSAALTLLGAQATPAPISEYQLWVGTTPTNLALVDTSEPTTLDDRMGLTVTPELASFEAVTDSLKIPGSLVNISFPYILSTAGYAQIKKLSDGVAYPITGVIAVKPA